jgi:hypothetical protein
VSCLSTREGRVIFPLIALLCIHSLKIIRIQERETPVSKDFSYNIFFISQFFNTYVHDHELEIFLLCRFKYLVLSNELDSGIHKILFIQKIMHENEQLMSSKESHCWLCRGRE